MPRIRAALGFAATSAPVAVDHQHALLERLDERPERRAVARRTRARSPGRRAPSAPTNAECTSAHRHGEFASS